MSTTTENPGRLKVSLALIDWAASGRTKFGLPSHMVAALFELDHGLTSMTTLPPFSLGLLEELIGILISGTDPAGMPPATAYTAHLGLAAPAFGIVAPILACANVFGLDKLTATWRWTVDAIPGRIFGELFVPRLLEGIVKKTFNILQGNILRAAFGRHALRILDRELKTPFQTRIAHSVSAFKLCSLRAWDFIVQANNARHARTYVRMMTGQRIRVITNSLSGVSGGGGWREAP